MTPAQRRLLHKLAKGLGYVVKATAIPGVCRFYPGRRLLNGNAFHTWTYEQAVSALTAQLLTQKETT